MNNKKFDCVKMTRDIQDNLYNQNKGKRLAKFVNTLVKESHNSSLWKKVKLVKKIRDIHICP